MFLLASFASAQNTTSVSRYLATLDDEFDPFVSADGQTIVFFTYDAQIQDNLLKYTKIVNGQWSAPKDVGGALLHSKFIKKGSYCLSHDGTVLVFASKKQPGVGGYDLWESKFDGQNWSTPINLTAPINSLLDDYSPSFDPNTGNLYFLQGKGASTKLKCASFFGDGFKAPTDVLGLPHGVKHVTSDVTGLGFFVLSNLKGVHSWEHMSFVTGKLHHGTKLNQLKIDTNHFLISMPFTNRIIYHSVKSAKGWDVMKLELPKAIVEVKEYYYRSSVSNVKLQFKIYDINTSKVAINGWMKGDKKTFYLNAISDYWFQVRNGLLYSHQVMNTGKSIVGINEFEQNKKQFDLILFHGKYAHKEQFNKNCMSLYFEPYSKALAVNPHLVIRSTYVKDSIKNDSLDVVNKVNLYTESLHKIFPHKPIKNELIVGENTTINLFFE